MSIFESIVVGFICITLVFLVLAVLFTMISILSRTFSKKQAPKSKRAMSSNTAASVQKSSVKSSAVQASKVQADAEKSPAVQASGVQSQSAQVSAVQPHSVQAAVDGLRLNNVDEKTAAMIMAIVSHETKTPLNQLLFRSICAVD